MVRSHEVNDAHTQLPLMLDHQQRIINDLIFAQKVHIFLQGIEESAVALLLYEVGMIILVDFEVGIHSSGVYLWRFGQEEAIQLLPLQIILPIGKALEAQEKILHDNISI